MHVYCCSIIRNKLPATVVKVKKFPVPGIYFSLVAKGCKHNTTNFSFFIFLFFWLLLFGQLGGGGGIKNHTPIESNEQLK